MELPILYLYDADGKPRASFDLYDSGVPNLELLAASGGTKGPDLLLEATEEGQVRLAFHDFAKKRVVGSMEFVMVDGAPRLKLIDDSGKTLRSTPAKH